MKDKVDGINRRLHITEEKISKLGDRAIETIQNNNNKNEWKKRKNRASLSCGKLSKGLIYLSGVSEGVEGVETEKIFGPKFSKFNENDKPTNSSSKISKHK